MMSLPVGRRRECRTWHPSTAPQQAVEKLEYAGVPADHADNPGKLDGITATESRPSQQLAAFGEAERPHTKAAEHVAGLGNGMTASDQVRCLRNGRF